MKLRKGDNVKVLSGNDKGKTGEILEVIPKKNKIIVKDVNIRKRARRLSAVKLRREYQSGFRKKGCGNRSARSSLSGTTMKWMQF